MVDFLGETHLHDNIYPLILRVLNLLNELYDVSML